MTRSPQVAQASRRVKDWTRRRFSLGDDDVVFVTELSCGLPGCPPVETVIAFWTSNAARHQFRVFKPMIDVTEDDLPPTWLKDALRSDGDVFTCC